jgi:hypothetical protein
VNKQRLPIVGSTLGMWRIEVGVKKSYSKRWAEAQDHRKGALEERCEQGNCSYCQGIRVQFLYYLKGLKRGIPKLGSIKNRYRTLS